jgi:hypothetical protein
MEIYGNVWKNTMGVRNRQQIESNIKIADQKQTRGENAKYICLDSASD